MREGKIDPYNNCFLSGEQIIEDLYNTNRVLIPLAVSPYDRMVGGVPCSTAFFLVNCPMALQFQITNSRPPDGLQRRCFIVSDLTPLQTASLVMPQHNGSCTNPSDNFFMATLTLPLLLKNTPFRNWGWLSPMPSPSMLDTPNLASLLNQLIRMMKTLIVL